MLLIFKALNVMSDICIVMPGTWLHVCFELGIYSKYHIYER